MELVNEFRVALPIDEAWKVLTDLERIAPCMPGAQLQGVEGDEYLGTVKVKVGPITAQYKGKATFEERDEAGHKAVIKAEGRESRGQGNANARVTATLTEDGTGTNVHLTTDLTISGKAAQFGRGVLADVSGKLLTQFVKALEADIASGAPREAAPEPEVPVAVQVAPAQGVQVQAAPTEQVAPTSIRAVAPLEPEPVNMIGVLAVPIAKRVAPVAVALLVGYLAGRRIGRSRRGD